MRMFGDPQKASGRLPRGAGPSFVVALLLHTGAAAALAFVPLFNLLGYEFSLAMSLLASLTAGPVAVAAVRRLDGYGRQIRRALGLNLLTLLPALGIISLNALRVDNCNYSTGLAFFALLSLATAGMATGWGLSLAWLLPKRPWTGLAYTGLWLLLAGRGLARIWSGVEVDSYNPLLGWVAGPIYDSVIEPGWTLLASRAHSLSWTLAAACMALLLSRPVQKTQPQIKPVGKLLVGGLLALAAAWGLGTAADSLGFGRSRNAIERALPVTIRTEHFVIHCPERLDAKDRSLLALDHEFRLHQIRQAIGELDLPPIHSYVFASARQKRKLVGAGNTQYAKPWQPMMVLHLKGFPHPTLKHELVHAAASAIGAWPTQTSASSAFWVNMGLTEGLAVGLDRSAGRQDPHRWSAALRRIGKAPDIRGLFDPVGFWSAAANRSYTLAGSFVRYLLETHGAEPLRAAYADGDLEGHYPKNTEQLIVDWEAFLDAIPLDEGTLLRARSRFAKGGIFEQTCAHEQAKLRTKAHDLVTQERWAEADLVIDDLLSHLAKDPRALELRMEMRGHQDRLSEAQKLGEQLLQHDGLGEAHKTRLTGRLGDLAVRQGRMAEARQSFEGQLATGLGDGSERSALIKLEALEQMEQSGLPCSLAGRQILNFLAEGTLDLGYFHDLMQSAILCPDWASAQYLVGRQLFNQQHFVRALPWLEQAEALGLAAPALQSANLRLRVQAAYHANHAQAAIGLAERLKIAAPLPTDPIWAQDWLERLQFEKDRSATEQK